MSATQQIFQDFYRDHFDLYENAFSPSNSNEKELQAALYAQAMRSFDQKQHFNDVVRVLDVGCGRGSITKKLLEKLERSFSEDGRSVELNILGIDPVEELLTEYKERTDESFEFVTAKSQPKTLERFLSPQAQEDRQENQEGKFDLILCDHSLYSVPAGEKHLTNLLTQYLDQRSGVCIIGISSKFSPVMTYRRRVLEEELLSSESIADMLNQAGWSYERTRYHSEFSVERENWVEVASWVEMEAIATIDKAQEILATLCGKEEGHHDKFSFINVADILTISPERNRNSNTWSTILGELFSREASDEGDRQVIEYVERADGQFQELLSRKAGFRECGTLLTGSVVDSSSLDQAETLPLIYCATHREQSEITADVKSDLVERFILIRESGILSSSGIDVEIPRREELETWSLVRLRNKHRELIQMAFGSSEPYELGDELYNFLGRAGDLERTIGTLWIDSGEHCFYSLLALLRSEEVTSNWKKVVEYGGLSSPYGINDENFIPSKRFERMMQWLRRVVNTGGEGDPHAITDLRQLLRRNNLSEKIGEISSGSGFVPGDGFEELIHAIWRIKDDINPRAVPEICFIVSAGMWCEAPNLLIFKLPEQKEHRAFGFVTCADIDDMWTDGIMNRSIEAVTSSVTRNVIQLISVFKQLFLTDVLLRLEQLIVDDLISNMYRRLLEPLIEALENDPAEASDELRSFPADLLSERLNQCEIGGDGREFENTCKIILRYLFGEIGTFNPEVSISSGRVDLVVQVDRSGTKLKKTAWKNIFETWGGAHHCV